MFYAKLCDLSGSEDFIYYPADAELTAFDTSLNLKVGECGQFTFRVPYSNINYSKLAEQKTIIIYKNDKEYWRGYIKEISKSFDMTLEVYCIEDLGWLNYEFMPPASTTKTKSQALQDIITYYNGLAGVAGTYKTFEVGYVINDNNIRIATTYEDSLLDTLRIIAGDNGIVRVRRTNGQRYIDIVTLDTYGTELNQNIIFGDNLLDYAKELNTSYMLNVIYAYGAELEAEELYEGVPKRIVGPVLTNENSIAKYGRIAKNILFNTADPETLASQAERYLQQNANPRVTIDLTAVDLAELGNSIDGFDIGNKVRVIADQLDINGLVLPITAQSINLQAPDKNKITLSSTVTTRTLTSQQTAITEELQKVPTKSSMLEAAKKNALNILNGVAGGSVTFETNEQGQITELRISDNINKDNVTKRWRWNMGGLGYEYLDQDPESPTYNEWVVADAMTMDGSIVADRITTGTLRGLELISRNDSGDYLDIKDGDIFGGDSGGEHGYLTFSQLYKGTKGISLVAPNGFVRMYGGNNTSDNHASVVASSSLELKCGNALYVDETRAWSGAITPMKNATEFYTITIKNGIITAVN